MPRLTQHELDARRSVEAETQRERLDAPIGTAEVRDAIRLVLRSYGDMVMATDIEIIDADPGEGRDEIVVTLRRYDRTGRGGSHQRYLLTMVPVA